MNYYTIPNTLFTAGIDGACEIEMTTAEIAEICQRYEDASAYADLLGDADDY